MREEGGRTGDQSWFARLEQLLPSPEELIPLSQSLITPDLALAFDIPAPNPNSYNLNNHASPHPAVSDSVACGSAGGASSSGGGGDETARTLKRPRLVWTPQLHKRFVDAVAHLGIKNAVPKTIMQLMSVEGLTRENVASHLQKYRLYLKRMQGGGVASGGFHADPATEQLFASSPVPHQFLSSSASHNFVQAFVSPPPVTPFQQQPPLVGLGHSLFLNCAAAQPGVYGKMVRQPLGHPGVRFAATPSMPTTASYFDVLEFANKDYSEAGGRRMELSLFPTCREH